MATILNYDPQGFIVGIGRVENNTKQLHNDTQEILRLLTAQRNAGNDSLQDMNQTLENIHTSLDRLPASLNQGRTREYSPRRATRPANTPRIQRTAREYGGNNSRPRNRTTPLDNSQSSRNPTFDRQRDAGGRFTARAEDAKFVDKLSNKLGDTFGKNLNVDDKNLDPLIDSFHEMKDALSPISGVLGFIRDKAEQRRERKHDKAVEDNLEAIAENTGSGGGNGGGRGSGFLGGMAGRMMGGLAGSALGGMAIGALGGVGKMATKLGGKRLGVLGTLLGAGSLAMDWGNLDHEGKSAGVGGLVGGAGGAMAGAATGAAIGSVVPVIGTAIGGVAGGLIGGWLGSEGGEVLGKTASPYIQSWTNSLEQYHLGDKLKTAFDFGMNPFFFGMTKLLPSLNKWVADTTGVDVAKGFSKLWDDIKAKLGFGSPTDPNAPIKVDTTGAANGSDIVPGEGWSAGANPFAGKKLTDAVIGGGVKGVVVGGGGRYGASRRGNAHGHTGQDIAVPIGTPVVAPEDGVLTIGATEHGGKEAYITTASGTRYGFAHLSDNSLIQSGQRVKAGTTIAKSGNTGIGSGPHVHLSVTKNRKKIDPNTVVIPNGGVSQSGAGVRIGGDNQGFQNYNKYDSIIQEMSRKHGVPANLIKGIMQRESSFIPDKVNENSGAAGLMQLMPATARRWGVKNRLDPRQSIEGGTKNLKMLMGMFGNDYDKIIGGYNAGEGNAKSGKMWSFPETRKYIPAVKTAMAKATFANGSGGQDIPQSTKLQALAATKKGMTPANVPAPPKPKIPKPPVVTNKISSDDNDDDKKSGWLSSLGLGGLIAQNVSDRGIAHAVTGGLGEDRWWG